VLGIGLARVIASSRSNLSPLLTDPLERFFLLSWAASKIGYWPGLLTIGILPLASDDYTVHLWDAATGKHTLIYRGHQSFVEGVAWSPDSKRLASGMQIRPWQGVGFL